MGGFGCGDVGVGDRLAMGRCLARDVALVWLPDHPQTQLEKAVPHSVISFDVPVFMD